MDEGTPELIMYIRSADKSLTSNSGQLDCQVIPCHSMSSNSVSGTCDEDGIIEPTAVFKPWVSAIDWLRVAIVECGGRPYEW